MEASRKLRIAISGGGLAGAAILNALSRQPHLDVNIYESAPAFSERGQAVGLSVNAQTALARLVSDSEEVFKRAGAMEMHSTRVIMGGGASAGDHVLDIVQERPGRIVHRAALLHELLAPMPTEKMHASKKLIEIAPSPDNSSLLLHFEDGSTAEADAVIGADGIWGYMRAYVLGKDHPAVQPVAAGWRGSHCLVPFDKAVAALGPERFKKDRQYGFIGQHGFMMHDTLSNRELVQCVGTFPDMDPEKKKSVDRVSLEKAFQGWHEGPVAKGMIDLLLTPDDPAAWAQWEHRDAPTYTKDSVCIAGDAAHAMTPWQGSGAGQALEDAVVLGELFAHAHSPVQVPAVLRVYDCVRRPRTQRIAASSRQTGRIMTGLDEEVGADPKKLHNALQDRWMYIFDFDLQKHVDNAVSMLQKELS